MKGKKLENKKVIEKIEEKCKEYNITFIGFDNEENLYTNNKVRLKLKCNKCGYEWNTMTYDKFTQKKINCKNCGKKSHYTNEEFLKKITNRCKELDYSFLGYVENNINFLTHLKLKCNKCGCEWDTTTILNFLKKNRKSHTCNRKNPLSMPQKFKDKKKIENEIKEILKETSLEFVKIIEDETIKISNYHVLLRCKKCNRTVKYSLRTIFLRKNKLKCKLCEINNKTSNEEAEKIIKEKCMILDYMFLGFDNKENKYNNKETKLKLKCNKCGYEWNTTNYFNFKNMTIKCRGCTNCWKMEKEIKYFLIKNNIEFEEQKKFPWLKNKISLSLDFYLPKYNIAIECQGRQHFSPIPKFGGETGFENTRKRDFLKKELCEKNGIKIYYYYVGKTKIDYFLGEKIIKNLNDLKIEIGKYEEKN